MKHEQRQGKVVNISQWRGKDVILKPLTQNDTVSGAARKCSDWPAPNETVAKAKNNQSPSNSGKFTQGTRVWHQQHSLSQLNIKTTAHEHSN